MKRSSTRTSRLGGVVLTFVVLGGLLASGLVGSLGLGSVRVTYDDVVGAFTESVPRSTAATIVRELRVPRILLAALVGWALGTAGAGFQGLFRNPLADPFVIGASSGAALGATLAIVLKWTGEWAGLSLVPISALGGALLTVSCVYLLASVGRQVPMVSLLLAGVAASSFVGALVSLLMFLRQEELVTIFGWILGSLSGRGWSELRSAAPLVLLGSTLLWLLARPLDALAFGEEAATALGLPLSRIRGLVVLAATLTTAAAVAASGIIGFVGLIAPHFARRLIGARHAYVVPASGLVGSLLLLVADDVARSVAAPVELPVGVVTALIGAPFFLVIVKRTRLI